MNLLADAIEQVIGNPEKEWPGLFSLYRNPDGSYRVELGTITAPLEWSLRWKLSEKEGQLAGAFAFVTGLSRLPICAVPHHMALLRFWLPHEPFGCLFV